jgi:hypothetical protein
VLPYGGTVLYLGYKDGVRVKEKVDFHPSLFVPDQNGSHKTLWNEPLREIEFGSINDFKEYLNDYDCVGQTFKPLGPTMWSDGSITENTGLGCYCGNFWWANASYIQTLDHNYLNTDYRFDREFWIGTNKNAKAKSFIQKSSVISLPSTIPKHLLSKS